MNSGLIDYLCHIFCLACLMWIWHYTLIFMITFNATALSLLYMTHHLCTKYWWKTNRILLTFLLTRSQRELCVRIDLLCCIYYCTDAMWIVMTLKELKKDLASVEKQTSRYQAEVMLSLNSRQINTLIYWHEISTDWSVMMLKKTISNNVYLTIALSYCHCITTRKGNCLLIAV